MIKAVFINYILSVILPKGEDFQAVSDEVVHHSKLNSTEEARDWLLKKMDSYVQDKPYTKLENTVLNILKYKSDDIKFKGSSQKVIRALQTFWMYAPISDDFKNFLRQCPIPVYIICNESADYVRVNLKRNNLHVAEVISADFVEKTLMNKEAFEKALEVAQVKKEEVLNISSILEELEVAEKEVGLNSILLDRNRKYLNSKHKRTRALLETLPQIFKELGDNEWQTQSK
ncbi:MULTISPECIES: hypothetical protein [Terrabacteria group]|uniref:hypothetical protein n=1 Tax=Bacillati TaxID=1783272 RepID=UPI00193AC164|nr:MULTISPECIES: hypothetical protein [Terrabacteria group]MBW9212643.1 hypothetical protein [Trueperella sp. zg.1013]QRG86869.1 hypothetical protein JOS54_00710 [Bulleidia sp. zg-1006]